MGTHYAVFVLDNVIHEEGGLDWLGEWGLDVPDPRPPGREPTLGEVFRAIESLEDVDLTHHVGAESMHVTISHKTKEDWASLVILDYQPETLNLDRPYEFYFEAGWIDLIREITQSLANVCGPLVLTENGEGPEILLPG
jgi:hypothetical protein